MNIQAKTIPHKKQRYATSGDYFKKGNVVNFRISKMNDDYEFLVLIHELVEYYFTKKNGISIKDIDTFDIEYEKNRIPGDTSEPGDDPEAPYFKEHQFATIIERLLATQLGIDWKVYDEFVQSL